MARFGLNSFISLDAQIGNLEAILEDEREIQDRTPTKKREKNIARLEQAIALLYECDKS